MKLHKMPQTRDEKIKYLNDFKNGKASFIDNPTKVLGTVIIHNGEYWDASTGQQLTKEEIIKLENDEQKRKNKISK